MKKIVISLTVMLMSITTIVAQDAEGCKEHPLLSSRMPNFYISDCSQKFDKLDYYDATGEIASKEGSELTIISYSFPDDVSLKVPSQLQIIRNYENAITKLGGKKIFVDQQNLSYSLTKNSKEYIICIEMTNGNIIHNLFILEVAQMVQEITANEMLDALNKDGYISLNILFETGKSAIQQESLPIIDQIYELMKNNTALKVSVEGHTNNVGDAASNKKLSTDRANSIKDAIIARRLIKQDCKWSMAEVRKKPVADNNNRRRQNQKNRRVEIVKKP
ncbi:MAG: OmpA family protein [Bacteroidetes bacterium]|nr:OmpA family protein [Bacteroidota bacterium]